MTIINSSVNFNDSQYAENQFFRYEEEYVNGFLTKLSKFIFLPQDRFTPPSTALLIFKKIIALTDGPLSQDFNKSNVGSSISEEGNDFEADSSDIDWSADRDAPKQLIASPQGEFSRFNLPSLRWRVAQKEWRSFLNTNHSKAFNSKNYWLVGRSSYVLTGGVTEGELIGENSSLTELSIFLFSIMDSPQIKSIRSSNFLSRTEYFGPEFQIDEVVKIVNEFAVSTIALRDRRDDIIKANILDPVHIEEILEYKIGRCFEMTALFIYLARQDPRAKNLQLDFVSYINGDHVFGIANSGLKFKKGDVIDLEKLSENAVIFDPWTYSVSKTAPFDFKGVAFYKDDDQIKTVPLVAPIDDAIRIEVVMSV